MSEPVLNGAKVHSRPEAPSCERRSELVQPEVFRVLFRATFAQRDRVANVALDLCSQKSSGFCSARSATAFRSSRKFIFALHPEVGKTKLHVLADFAFCALRLVTNFAGIGISGSLYAFGVQPRSGLWLTRTVEALKLMSDQ